MDELGRRLDAFDRGEMPPGSPWEEVDAWLDTLASIRCGLGQAKKNVGRSVDDVFTDLEHEA